MSQTIIKNQAYRRFTEERILKAIEGSGGIISAIARRLNCTWPCANDNINKFPRCVEALENERQIIVDISEDVLFTSIKNGDVSSAKWLLSRLRPRLYSEKYEISAVTKPMPELNGLSFEELMELKASLDEPEGLLEEGS